jgi:tetratricopeptide (TPR) repeat protein
MRNFIGSMFGKSKKGNLPEGQKKRVEPAVGVGDAIGAPIPGTPYKKGDLIGQEYEVHGVLGKGGFGIVYLVYSPEHESAFALKTFRDEYMEDAATRERFWREARVWVDLERHPFLVRAYFVNEINGRLYVAMEHIAPDEQGLNSLDGYLQRRPPDLAQTLRWAIQFCYGMEHAYSKGLRCHRDIKPSNIMLTQDRTVKISDFGLAGVLDIERPAIAARTSGTLAGTKTMKGTSFGTPEYMPPEQFVNAAGCDERSDIYSFGIVLHQLASRGGLPFAAPDRSFSTWKRIHAERPLPNLDSPLSAIIGQCLEKRPDARYQTFAELRGDLEELLGLIYEEVFVQPQHKELEAWEWNNKGLGLDNLGRPEEAVGCYDRALGTDSGLAEAWGNKGNCLITLRRYEDAIQCHDRALDLNPRLAAAWGKKGIAFAMLGRYEDALWCYDRALGIDPRLEFVWSIKGSSLDILGRSAEAIRCFDRAIDIDSRYARAWSCKGHCLRGLCRNEEAVRCYDRALEINPRDDSAWSGKGDCLNGLGRAEEAIRCYNGAVEIDPRSALAWSKKGATLNRLGRYEEAVRSLDKALEIDPRDALAWSSKGTTLASLGRHEEAIPCYDRALEIDPRDALTWSIKGSSLGLLGRHEEAIHCLDRALEIDPRDGAAWTARGASLNRLSRHEEAIRSCCRALEIDQRSALAWYNRARAEEGLGRKRDSVGSYKQVLAVGSARNARQVEYARERLRDLEGK